MKEEIGRLVKHTGIYGLGTILSRSVGFLLIPLYTRFLTPADYGVLELLDLTMFFSGIFCMMGISAAVFRFYVVLAVAHEGGTAELVREGQAGWVVNPDDTGAIKRTLREILRVCQRSAPPRPSRPEFVEQFRCDRLAEQLASVFDSASNHGE
jgi:glycosyltransferase involved in cell wall biosynthesis